MRILQPGRKMLLLQVVEFCNTGKIVNLVGFFGNCYNDIRTGVQKTEGGCYGEKKQKKQTGDGKADRKR